MAEIVLGILRPLLGKLGEDLVNLIKKQVSYLCCYSCNVRKLGDEVSELKRAKESVNEKIESARVDWGNIRPTNEVEDWLSKVDDIEEKSSRIRNDLADVQKSCLSSWCPFLHYSLSREAQKTTKASEELRERPTKFPEVARRLNAPDLDPVPVASEGLESRESVESEILDALKKNDVYLIGICGMGGVGKSTMVENIEKRAREKTADSMFDRVVKVVVSQNPNLSQIQRQIAERLGFKLDEETLDIRAERLHDNLKNAKSILIILDDVWERLNLEKIGIPSQSTHSGCKLILTSRDRKALTLTEDAKIFPLNVLSEQESRILFRKHAGNSTIDSQDLYGLAKDILKECKGLPLAIVTVGCALRDMGRASWEDALSQLRQPIPGNVPPLLKDVYGPLLCSFDRLESEEYRYLLLLCCLFPEDYVISLEELVRYGMGLGTFKGIKNLIGAEKRVESILENLIFRSLLIKSSDGWGNLRVKMHDVIRDVGIWIAPKWKHVLMISHGMGEWPNEEERDYTGISLSFSGTDIDVPECIDYPMLELFCICGDLKFELFSFCRDLKLPDNFFTGMKSLKVLEASKIESLPSSINLLNNLRTLRLSGCNLGMISVIGELINLEILCLKECDFVEVLPKEIGKLKRLRKLDITDCRNLRKIAFGVVSGLVQLEELTIVRSFKEWEAEEKDEEISNNASLVELDSLSHLTTLCIEIWNPNAIPKKIPDWVHKVKKYSVSVAGEDRETSNLLRFQKSILLGVEVVTPLREWFYDYMARDAQCLDLRGQSNCKVVVNRLIPAGSQNLTCFKLYKCSNVKYLIDASVEVQENGAIFPVLKTLKIEDSCSLEQISNGPPPLGSFRALEEIRLEKLSRLVRLWALPNEKLDLSSLKLVNIRNCDNLLYLPLSIAECLLRLEELEVSNCPVMKEIFKREEGEIEITINKIKFPKLYNLCLKNLPSLQGFYEGVDGIVEVPVLRNLIIANLPSSTREGDHNVQQQFLFDQRVAANGLQLHVLVTPLSFFNFSGTLHALTVEGLHNFKSLFSPSAPLGSFPNLRQLTVRDCSKLEEVIGKEENVVGETKTKTLLFPQLLRLFLVDLPKLLAFSHGMGSLAFAGTCIY